MKATARRRSTDTAVDPLMWTFDGPLATCIVDIEDTLRRLIVQLDEVAGIAVALDVSLPALAARVRAGESLQPAWSAFLERIATRYGLPCAPRVRHRMDSGPLATLIVIYRS
jgi:hypothetical protein